MTFKTVEGAKRAIDDTNKSIEVSTFYLSQSVHYIYICREREKERDHMTSFIVYVV